MNKIYTYLQSSLSPQRCYHRLTQLSPWLFGLSICLIPLALYWGLFLAPTDIQQGEGYRILYIHVPCAFFSLALYSLLGLASIAYLVWRVKVFQAIAESAAYLGVCYTALALITGSLWGKPMWGTWWVWDARLTSEFILLCLYLGYLLLAEVLKDPTQRARACAILAVIGLVDLPIIHYSVIWWHTLHQGPTLLQTGHRAMALSMQYPLWTMLGGFALFSGYILSLRIRLLLLKMHQNAQWVRAC